MASVTVGTKWSVTPNASGAITLNTNGKYVDRDITVNPSPSQTKAATGAGTVSPDSGKLLSSVTVGAGTLSSKGGSVSGTKIEFVTDTSDPSGVSVVGGGQGTVTKAGWIGTGDATASTQTKNVKGITLSQGKQFEITNDVTNKVTVKYTNDTNCLNFIFS